MQSMSIFLNITKFAGFWWKKTDVSRTQDLCYLIYILFGSSLDKVELS